MLIAAIVLSTLVVMLDSVATISARFRTAFVIAEWSFTALFTVEYLLRLWTSREPWRYARSFYGMVDLLTILPSFLAMVFPEGRFLVAFRLLRVLRIFRILKLAHYVREASVLSAALRASRHKITVFVSVVVTVVVIVGSVMYLVEGPASGFTSIPIGIYWAIVTLTTVGYGDVAPVTVLGRTIASVLMVLGYGIIAVPTGIVTLELDRAARGEAATASARRCDTCDLSGHERDAVHCRRCGERLSDA